MKLKFMKHHPSIQTADETLNRERSIVVPMTTQAVGKITNEKKN